MSERNFLSEELEEILLEIPEVQEGLAELWIEPIKQILADPENMELLEKEIKRLEQLVEQGRVNFIGRYHLLKTACFTLWARKEEEKQL